MRLTKEKITEFVLNAKKAGASPWALDALSSLPLEEILEHRDFPYWAYWYALYVIKGRWKEAEEVIKSDPGSAYRYAQDVIEGEWE